MDLMFQPLRKYATFSGRARRAEYWLFFLLFSIVYVTLVVSSGGFEDDAPAPTGIALIIALMSGLAFLGLLIPMFAVHVRRLHDTNRSAWWLLISFIPLIGSVVLLVFSVLEGTRGSNEYGPDPKGPSLADATVFS